MNTLHLLHHLLCFSSIQLKVVGRESFNCEMEFSLIICRIIENRIIFPVFVDIISRDLRETGMGLYEEEFHEGSDGSDANYLFTDQTTQ